MLKTPKPSVSILDVVNAYFNSDTHESIISHIIRTLKLGFEIDFLDLHKIQDYKIHQVEVNYMCEKAIKQTLDNVDFNSDQCICEWSLCVSCNAQLTLNFIFRNMKKMSVSVISELFDRLFSLHSNITRLHKYLIEYSDEIKIWLEDKIILSDFDHPFKPLCKKVYDVSQLRDVTKSELEHKFGIVYENRHKVVLFLKNSEMLAKIKNVFKNK